MYSLLTIQLCLCQFITLIAIRDSYFQLFSDICLEDLEIAAFVSVRLNKAQRLNNAPALALVNRTKNVLN